MVCLIEMAQTCFCGPIEHKVTEERRREIKKVSRDDISFLLRYDCFVWRPNLFAQYGFLWPTSAVKGTN